jgi:protein-S-isoprenylcysteine O-methyltransferase Ste14
VILAYHHLYPQPLNTYILRYLTNSSVGAHPRLIAQTLSLSLILGTLIATWGIWFRTRAYKALGRHFTFHVSLQKDHTLITDWPYNVVRHPSYTGAFMTYIGLVIVLVGSDTWVRTFFWEHLGMQGGMKGTVVAFMTAVPVIIYSMAVIMLFKRMDAEDRMLQQTFGVQWVRWAQEVPFKLIPGIY